MIPKECRVYKVLKTILLSRPARDNDVRFRYSNRAGTSILWGIIEFYGSESFFVSFLFDVWRDEEKMLLIPVKLPAL